MKLKDKVVIDDRLGMFRGVHGTIVEEGKNRFKVAFSEDEGPYWFSDGELRKR